MKYPIARYLNARLANRPSFAPDGRELAFLSDITGLPQVWQIALPPSGALAGASPPWPDPLTFAAERVMNAVYAPSGPRRLLYTHDTGGDENAQLFLLEGSVATGLRTSRLSAGHEGVMHIPGAWAPDVAFFLFAANRRDPGLFDLYRQTPDGAAAELVWRNDAPGYLYHMAVSPDGRLAAFNRTASSFDHALFTVDLATGQARAWHDAAEPARYVQPAFATDGRSLYLVTDQGRDFMYVARLDLGGGALEPLITPEWDVTALALAPDRRSLAYSVNEAGGGLLYHHDLATGRRRQAPAVEATAGVIAWEERLAFSPDGRRLAFSYTSPLRTDDIFVWDIDTNELAAVTRSTLGGLPADGFAAPELIAYPAFDGHEIPAWFFAADGPAPAPVVVIVHGGPEGQARPIFLPIVQYLVHNGYAVLVPNVRGSTGYGKAYTHLDDVRLRMDSVADLAHAVDWLRAEPRADADRVAVYGGSYGGFMVLAALTHYPALWRAGVNVVGISNFVTFLEHTSAYRRGHREAEYGSLEHDRDFLESIAPINHVDKIVAPLLVIHGANDPRVPLSEAEQLVAALAARDVPADFIVFDDEGHGIYRLKNKLVAYPAIVEFLNRHLRANGA